MSKRARASLAVVTLFVIIVAQIHGLGLSNLVMPTAHMFDRAAIDQGGALDVPSVAGCTVFTVSHGDQVFFAGNNDWINCDSCYYWVDPGTNAGYGAIYFGVPEDIQQGVNERGLAYDANGLPPSPVNPRPGLEPVRGGYASYPIEILRQCATVEEVISWVETHQWHETMHDQMHFADPSGDAVVISIGPDGEVSFTRKPQGDGSLVSTNFNLANPSNANPGSCPTCWRYNLAQELLAGIDDTAELTAERVASILEAVHVESSSSWTVESVVADLTQGVVYVYLYGLFDAPIVLNVAEEIARAPDPGPLRDLFPPETGIRIDRAGQQQATRPIRCNKLNLFWLGLVTACLGALLLVPRLSGRSPIAWVLVVLLLGPAGLLTRLIAARGKRASAVVEVAGDLPPYVAGMVMALLIVALAPPASASDLWELLVLYGCPLIFGLLLYQAPLLARDMGISYARSVLRRLPTVLVSTNLSMAGIFAIVLPLANWHLPNCGFNSLTALSWWAYAALGALAGGLLLYIYHTWAISRGFVTWSASLWSIGETVSSPTWRRLWIWIVLSFVASAAGLVLGSVGASLVTG